MKKRVFSVVLAALCALTALAFVGCTDKPRKLDAVEQSVVGEWKNGIGNTYTFNADGTYTHSNNGVGGDRTWKHDGDWIESEDRGHYNIILITGTKYALFDDYPDLLCCIHPETGKIDANDDMFTYRRVAEGA